MSTSNVVYLRTASQSLPLTSSPKPPRAPQLSVADVELSTSEQLLVTGLLLVSALVAPQVPPLLSWLAGL